MLGEQGNPTVQNIGKTLKAIKVAVDEPLSAAA